MSKGFLAKHTIQKPKKDKLNPFNHIFNSIHFKMYHKSKKKNLRKRYLIKKEFCNVCGNVLYKLSGKKEGNPLEKLT